MAGLMNPTTFPPRPPMSAPAPGAPPAAAPGPALAPPDMGAPPAPSPDAPPPGPAPAPPAGAGMLNDPNAKPTVTPEAKKQAEQQRDQIVDVAYKIIYDKAVMQPLIQRLGATQDYAGNLGQLGAMVMLRVFGHLKQQGVPLQAGALVAAAGVINLDLAELAEKAKVHTYTKQEVVAAMQRLVTIAVHTMIQTKMLTPQQVQQLQQVAQQHQATSGQPPQPSNPRGPGIHGHILAQAHGMMPPGAQGGAPQEPNDPAPEDDENEPGAAPGGAG